MGMEEELIIAVEKYPIIYDKTLKEYRSNNARESAWKSIAEKLKRNDVEALKKRWRSLRDAFIKYHRAEKTSKSGEKGEKKKKWGFYDIMQFLLPHIEYKEDTVGNYDEFLKESTPDLQEQNEAGENIDESNLCGAASQKIIRNTIPPQNKPLSNSQKKKIYTDDPLLQLVTKADDPDEQFLLSCVPIFKRLSPRQNMMARIQIQTLLYNIEFNSNDDCGSAHNDYNLGTAIINSFDSLNYS